MCLVCDGILTGKAYRHLFHDAGNFFENQLKASGLSAVRTAPYCFQKSTVYDNVLLRYVETFHVCANDYGLEETIYCIYFGASWTCFSVITSQTGTYVDELWKISDGPRCALTQEKLGKSRQGFRLRLPKRVFLLSMQCGLSDTCPAPISTMFETADVNRFPHTYTGDF